MTHADLNIRPQTGKAAGLAFAAGIAGVAAMGLGYAADAKTFHQAFLMAFVFWVNMSLGCLAVVILHHMTGGGWGLMIRRIGEAGIKTLPLMALLFVPLALVGVHSLYKWADPQIVKADHIIQHKAPYLNVAAFQARGAIYFALWILSGLALVRLSRRQDETGDPGILRRFQWVAAPAGILYFLTATFSSVDWGMSLDPHWFSTMYGVIFIIGQGLGALALMLAVAILLARTGPLRGVLRTEYLHDLGKLMLAFTMLWAYVSFSQFLIVYSANIKEEIPYYIRRFHGGWEYLSVALIAFNFAVPFLVLLSRDLKRNPRPLLAVALYVIVFRFADIFWTLAPSMRGDAFRVHWMDFAALAGIGGLWLGVFLKSLATRPAVPVNDPRLEEALANGGH